MTAKQIVEGMPDSPQAIEDYLMNRLGNRRVEIIARKFFRVQILPYLRADDYVIPGGLAFEVYLRLCQDEFLRSLKSHWWAQV